MLKIDPCPFRPHRREITKTKIAAASRAIKKEKQKLPLFAHEVQDLPAERAEANIDAAYEYSAHLRRCYLEHYRELRNFFRAIPAEKQRELEGIWSRSVMPKTPSYAFEFLNSQGVCKSVGQLVDGKFIVTRTLLSDAEVDS